MLSNSPLWDKFEFNTAYPEEYEVRLNTEEGEIGMIGEEHVVREVGIEERYLGVHLDKHSETK